MGFFRDIADLGILALKLDYYLGGQSGAAMRAGETELQMCIRHVAEQEIRVARQDILVARLREIGAPILGDALRLLAAMHDLLDTMRAHVAALK